MSLSFVTLSFSLQKLLQFFWFNMYRMNKRIFLKTPVDVDSERLQFLCRTWRSVASSYRGDGSACFHVVSQNKPTRLPNSRPQFESQHWIFLETFPDVFVFESKPRCVLTLTQWCLCLTLTEHQHSTVTGEKKKIQPEQMFSLNSSAVLQKSAEPPLVLVVLVGGWVEAQKPLG